MKNAPLILLVDDQEANRYSIGRMLHNGGLNVRAAACGTEALEILAATRVDAVVCDVRLPDLNGYEILQRIRTNPATAQLPVLLVSAYFNERELEGTQLQGTEADAYLPTPVEAPVLLASIRALLRAREAETSLRGAKATAEAANRAKDQFIAVLSHELRTPLTPVLTALAMLRSDERLPADMRETLEMIGRNVEVEVRLIADLLDVSRVLSGKLSLEKRETDIARAIAEAVRIVDPDVRAAGQSLTIEALDAPYPALADSARLQQLFWNLLRNAIKFSPAGSAILVRARRVEAQSPEEDGTCPVLEVEVIDQGRGIDPETMPTLFNAFQQGPGTQGSGGLGLGLSICRAVADAHGGSITGRSDGIGRGATFTVRLPLLNQTRPGAGTIRLDSASSAERPGASPRGARVLLVEDHADTARAMKQFLALCGYDVVIAGCVAEALAAARQSKPDVLVSDVGLPDGTGLELLGQLLAEGHRIPAIALSGYGTPADVERSLEAGFVEHLVKPLTSLDLLTLAIDRLERQGREATGSRC